MICWSGGCDSTLLLYDRAKNSSSIWPERTISINHCNVPNIQDQAKARQKILVKLKDKGFHIEPIEATFENTSYPIKESLIQPQIWLSIAVQYLRKDEDLYMGYIMGDCIWQYKTELINAFNALQAIGGKTGQLQFPLQNCDKTYVIQGLTEAELINDVWFCEGGIDGIRCNRCGSCKRHLLAIWEMESFNAHYPDPNAPSPDLKITTADDKIVLPKARAVRPRKKIKAK